jgi:hypothetical protein
MPGRDHDSLKQKFQCEIEARCSVEELPVEDEREFEIPQIQVEPNE